MVELPAPIAVSTTQPLCLRLRGKYERRVAKRVRASGPCLQLQNSVL